MDHAVIPDLVCTVCPARHPRYRGSCRTLTSPPAAAVPRSRTAGRRRRFPAPRHLATRPEGPLRGLQLHGPVTSSSPAPLSRPWTEDHAPGHGAATSPRRPSGHRRSGRHLAASGKSGISAAVVSRRNWRAPSPAHRPPATSIKVARLVFDQDSPDEQAVKKDVVGARGRRQRAT